LRNLKEKDHLENIKVKIKESRNRPGVAQRVPGSLGSQISMTFGT
jgi:hypothetical protein